MKQILALCLFSICLFTFGCSKPTYAINPTPNTGSITICQLVVDTNNVPILTDSIGQASFQVTNFTPSASLNLPTSPAAFPTQSFSLPLQLNTRILNTSTSNDAECHSYQNLPLGSYYYTDESINSINKWSVATFDDFAGITGTPVSGFHSYDSKLYTDPANANTRSYQADGNIYLTSQSPDRVVAIMAQFINITSTTTPTVTQTPVVIAAPNPTNTINSSSASLTTNTIQTPTTIQQGGINKIGSKVIGTAPLRSITDTPSISPSPTISPSQTTSLTPTNIYTPSPTVTHSPEDTFIDGFKGNQNAYWLLFLFIIPLLIFFFILMWYKQREKDETN